MMAYVSVLISQNNQRLLADECLRDKKKKTSDLTAKGLWSIFGLSYFLHRNWEDNNSVLTLVKISKTKTIDNFFSVAKLRLFPE